jgi:hypothetical protein
MATIVARSLPTSTIFMFPTGDGALMPRFQRDRDVLTHIEGDKL